MELPKPQSNTVISALAFSGGIFPFLSAFFPACITDTVTIMINIKRNLNDREEIFEPDFLIFNSFNLNEGKRNSGILFLKHIPEINYMKEIN